MTEAEKQAKKVLTALRKAATKLKVEFTDETTAEQLTILVEEAKAKAEAEKQALKTEFTVLNSSGDAVRTYSVEIHGNQADKLAEQYAGKIGGSVA